MTPVSAFSSTQSTHAVQFYEEDEALIERLSEFAGSALGGGHACIVIATQSHLHALQLHLLRRGMDLDQMENDGRFFLLDASETLELFMLNGEPEEARFFPAMEGILSKASSAIWGLNGRLAVFGEMVALLWADGNTKAAVRLEELWNELAKKYTFSLLCAYPMQYFGREEDQAAFKNICAQHDHLLPSESYGKLFDEASKLQNICELQQKAQMLRVEVVRRKTAEGKLKMYEESARSVN
jgi:hypothetical protein